MRLIHFHGLSIAIDTDLAQSTIETDSAIVYLNVPPIDLKTNKPLTSIQLVAKIVLYENKSQKEASNKKIETTTTHEWQRATPRKQKSKKAILGETITEARNGNILFSSHAIAVKEGAMILMAKIPGDCLLNLIETIPFKKLTPIKRIELAINVIAAYEKLHAQGVVHGDASATNIIIDLETLQTTPIDINNAYATELTQAPEKKAAVKSDSYSIAQDILMTIFAGIRPEKDLSGKIVNAEAVHNAICSNFIDPSLDLNLHLFLPPLFKLLEKMHSIDPNQRGTLQEARQSLEELKPLINASLNIDPIKQQNYQKQLRILDQFILPEQSNGRIPWVWYNASPKKEGNRTAPYYPIEESIIKP